MKKRILSLLLAFLMVFGMFPAFSTHAAGGGVSVMYFNPNTEAMEEASTVELFRGGEVYLSAEVSVSGGVQWQIEAGQDLWVDIQGETAQELRVSYGMIQSLLRGNAVRMRCAVMGEEASYSNPFTVVVTEEDTRAAAVTFNVARPPVAPDPLPAPVGVKVEVQQPVVEEEQPVVEEEQPVIEEEQEPVVEEEQEPVIEEEQEPVVEEEQEPVVEEEQEPVIEEEQEPVVEEEQQSEDEGIITTGVGQVDLMLSSETDDSATINDDVTNEDLVIHTVTIEYVYADSSKFRGQRVALPYIAEVADGVSLDKVVASPNCVGYVPNMKQISFPDAITGNITHTVTYAPAQVSYTVRHYQQNVGDDEYSWVDTTMATGYTEKLTSDAAAKTYTGFTALSHYHEEIAADSSTMIDIYYDRNYYLMSFDLDGGHGVSAVYARYGANISVANPQKAGYGFAGWSSDGTTKTTLPSVMPAGNSSYTALWTAETANYTIAYWLENANSDEYDFVGTKTAQATSGGQISGSDDAVTNGIFTQTDRQYYSFNADKTDSNVTVSGDGNSVVNVYYDRNEYTLKFYYARSNKSYTSPYCQVAIETGGSSNNGGTVAHATYSYAQSGEPTLDDAYTKVIETIGYYNYYYFTLTAKYGANLEAIWPNAPLGDFGGKKFVSWGTQYGSGYHTGNDNKNIKGVYSVMDSGLLIDPTMTADKGVNHWMVAYWASPTMYTYEIYYDLLAGEIADRTYNGTGYKKITQYTVGSTDNPSGQSALSFEGVVNVGKDYDSNQKIDGTAVRFYYKRNIQTVNFDNTYGVSETYTVPYGGTLSDYINPVPEAHYPDELPKGAYKFGGWYQTKGGIGALNMSITMPNENLIYYANWVPLTYTVTIENGYNVQLSTETVGYGDKATKPSDPTMDDAVFIGWYYVDEDGKEQRFDFDNMTVTGDITIYAKWRSTLMKQVQIHYVVEDEDGTQTPVADSESMMLRVGQTRTLDAKTGSSLYLEYRESCFPTTATHSITPTAEDTAEDLTWTFVYKKYGNVPYQVEFYVVDENGFERPAFKKDANGKAVFMETYDDTADVYVEEHWDNSKAVVTELYIPDSLAIATWELPDQYLPNALKLQQVIVPHAEKPDTEITANVIKFVYTYSPGIDPDTGNIVGPGGTPVYPARYLVQHFIQSDAGGYELYSYTDESELSGTTVTASPISIPGYTFNSSETNNKMQAGTTLDTATNVMTGTVTADDGLELNFYYTVNSYPYQVMYLEEGSNRVLAPTKTTDANGNQLKAAYGSRVTEEAIAIEGYKVAGASTKQLYIQMEAGENASVNTIVFYYSVESADLIISKTVELDEEQAKEEGIAALPDSALTQDFEFTVTCPTGYHKSVYDYTITNANWEQVNAKLTADTTTLTVKLKHGQTIAIHGLAMGKYIVKETYVPGFNTSVDNVMRQEYEVTLTENDGSATAAYTNRYPFYTGDLVLKKNVVKENANDPNTAEPFKVTVVLTPSDEAREVNRKISWRNYGDFVKTTFTVPKLTGENDQRTFTFDVLVPANGEVVLEGVPVGGFTATEVVDGTGFITDYYTVTYNKALHQNDEVKGTNHEVSGDIHGGHPTEVTFTNTYKKGTLNINKTVTQEYVNDTWQSDTFTFSVEGTTVLPDGTYPVAGYTVKVDDGKVTVKDADGKNPTVTVTRTEGANAWSNVLSIAGLPAGYYTVKEIGAGLGLDMYNRKGAEGNVLVNSTTTATEATFTNTYKRQSADLTIETTCSDSSQSFVFDVREQGGPIALKVVLVGNDSQTIKDLPVGTYIVSEQGKWSWREAEDATDTVELTATGATVPFNFGAVDRLSWLSGYHYNIGKKGGNG